MPARLGLGTVQFGMPYGIANGGRRPEPETVRAIVERAAALGVAVLDTAQAYGDSEAVLGGCAASRLLPVVTKIPPLKGERPDLAALVRGSLDRLGIDRLDGLLCHDAADARDPQVLEALKDLRECGLTRRIGVSFHDFSQIEPMLDLGLDLAQLPVSVLDQRVLRDGLLRRMADAGMVVHARSVFLQGVLLMDRLPPGLTPLAHNLAAFRARAAAAGMTPEAAALAFVRDLPGIEAVLVGVMDVAQLEAAAAAIAVPSGFDAAGLGCDDQTYLDPWRWPK